MGSSSYLTDYSGIPSHYYNYLPFGEEMVSQNTSSYNNVYRFSGKELDEETGLSYFGARYYNPKWSVWLSVDPLAESFPDWNPYNYTMQNPINLVDPTGMSPEGPDDPPKTSTQKTAPEVQGLLNVGKKWLCFGVSAILDPIGTTKSVIGGTAQEGSDFIHKDGGKLPNTISRKAAGAYDSYTTRLSNSSDPGYENSVIAAELLTEISINVLLTKGASSILPKSAAGLNLTKQSLFNSIDDIMANPNLLKGTFPSEVAPILEGTPGWRVEKLGAGSQKGNGWVFRHYNEKGNSTGMQLRWHPGGGHHGPKPYWRVVGPNGDIGGIIR